MIDTATLHLLFYQYTQTSKNVITPVRQGEVTQLMIG